MLNKQYKYTIRVTLDNDDDRYIEVNYNDVVSAEEILFDISCKRFIKTTQGDYVNPDYLRFYEIL